MFRDQRVERMLMREVVALERATEALERIALCLEHPMREAELTADIISEVNRELGGGEVEEPEPFMRLEVEGE